MVGSKHGFKYNSLKYNRLDSTIIKICIAIILVGLVTTLFAGQSVKTSALLLISSDYTHAVNTTGTVKVKSFNSSGDAIINRSINLSINYPNGSLFYNNSQNVSSTGIASFSFSIPSNAPIGVYTITATASSSGSNPVETISSNFKVIEELLTYDILIVNSSLQQPVLVVQSTANGSAAYLNQTFGVTIAGISSKSDNYYYTNMSINNQTWYFLIVDTTVPGFYDKVIIDDDKNFNLLNNSEDNNQSLNYTEMVVGEFEPWVSNKAFPVDYFIARLQPNGQRFIAISPVGRGVFSPGEVVKFIISVVNDQGVLQQKNISVRIISPSSNIITKQGNTSNYVFVSNFTPNLVGDWIIEVNNASSSVVGVESFKMIIDTTTPTGDASSSFAPGSKVIVETLFKTASGNIINLSTTPIAIITAPSGSKETHILSREDDIYKATFTQTTEQGAYNVLVNASYNNTHQHATTGFSVVSTNIMLEAINPKYIDRDVELKGFAPGDRAYIILIGFNISNGFPVALNCSNYNITSLEKAGVSYALNNLNISSVAEFVNSSEFQELINNTGNEGPPPDAMNFCMARFNLPLATGNYLVRASYKQSQEAEKLLTTTLPVVKSIGELTPQDESGQEFFQFTPEDMVYLHLEAYDIINDQELASQNITNITLTSLKELETQLTVSEVSNFTYNSTTGVISFIAPNTQGVYEILITYQALINDSGNISWQQGTATGFFELRKYIVYGFPAESSDFGMFFSPNDNITLEVHVVEPEQAFGGGSGPSNAFIKPVEVWNFMLNKRLDINNLNFTGSLTSNGIGNITLSNPSSWDSGFYGVRLMVNDTNNVVSYGWAGFEVRNLWVEAMPVLLQNNVYTQSQQLSVNSTQKFVVIARDPRASFDELLDINSSTVLDVQSVRTFPPSSVDFDYSYNISTPINFSFGQGQESMLIPSGKAALLTLTNLPTTSGQYRLFVRVSANSKSDVAESWFSVVPFMVSVSSIDRDYPLYGSSETMELLLTASDFGSLQGHNISNVSLEQVFSLKQHDEITNRFNSSEFTASCQANNCSVNLTLANNDIEKGEYVIMLTVTDTNSSSTNAEYWFMVRDQVIATPWIDSLYEVSQFSKDSSFDLDRNDHCMADQQYWANPLNGGFDIRPLFTINMSQSQGGSYTPPTNAWKQNFSITWNITAKDFMNSTISNDYKSSSSQQWLWNSSTNTLYLGSNNPGFGNNDGWIVFLNNSDNFTGLMIYNAQAQNTMNITNNTIAYLPDLGLTATNIFGVRIKGWINVTLTSNNSNGSVMFLSFLKDNQSIVTINALTNFQGVNYNNPYVIYSNSTNIWIDDGDNDFSNDSALSIGSVFNDTATLPTGSPMQYHQHIELELDNISIDCVNCPHVLRFSASGNNSICYQSPNNNSDIEIINLPQAVYNSFINHGLVGWAKAYPGDEVCYQPPCSDIYSTLQQNNITVLRPEKVYIAANTTDIWVNTSSNLTTTTPVGIDSSFEDAENGLWTVKNIYIGQDEAFVQVSGINVLDNGFKVNTSLSQSGKFRLLNIVSESQLGIQDPSTGQSIGYDIDNNSDLNGKYLVLMLDTNQSKLYDAIIVSNSTNSVDFSDDRLIKVSDNCQNRSYGRWRFLSIDSNGQEARFYELFTGEWSDFGSYRVNNNITIPFIALNPDGTPQPNVNITVFKVVRSYQGFDEEQLLNIENNTITTNTDGVAEYTTSFSNAGSYRLGIRSGDNVLEEWKWPSFDVRAFIATIDKGKAFVVSNFSTAEELVISPDSIKPFSDANGSKMQQNWTVTATTGEIPAMGANCTGYESPWGDQSMNDSVIHSDQYPNTFMLYIYNTTNASNSELYISIGDCNFTDNNQPYHIGGSILLNYTGWWGAPIEFNLSFKLATEQFFFLGIDPGAALSMPVETENFNEKRWFATRLKLGSTTYTLLLAKNTSLITNDTPDWLMANTLFVTTGNNFSGSSPIKVGETVIGDYKLQSLLSSWDKLILVNTSNHNISFAMPEQSRDNTLLRVGIVNESVVGDLNNDNLQQVWWFVLYDDWADSNNALTKIIVDDDSQLFSWDSTKEYYGDAQGLQTAIGNMPLEYSGNINMPSNNTNTSSNLDLLEFDNTSNHLLALRRTGFNSNNNISLIINVKDFAQQSIDNASVLFTNLRITTPFGMNIVDNSTYNITYPIGNRTDVNGYAIINLIPLSSWQQGFYELTVDVNNTATGQLQTVRDWFCIGCGGDQQ